jgi:pentatricopeptide repeat protein
MSCLVNLPLFNDRTTVLRICQKSREATAALSVFDRMKQSGVKPDRFAYQVVISSCMYLESATDSWQRAVALLQECDKLLPLTGTGGIMDGKLAMSIFSSAISACERAAQGQVALDLYDQMSQRVNLPLPDLITVSSIVAACEVESDWTKLDKVLKTSKVTPDLILYHQLIRIAGKKHDPRMAFNLLQAAVKQGLHPTRGTYRELVEACQTSAGWVPNGPYLLSQAKQLLKKAFSSGSSMNEDDTGPVADFLLHGQKCTTSNGPGGSYEAATRKMLDVISVTTEFRLHDHSALPELGRNIPLHSAQQILALHCEKQALAALLEAAGSSEDTVSDIRLSVSLCMCSDCHMIFKYASQGYGRKIECEDPSRRHCFERGVCSCEDNWPGKNRPVKKLQPVDIISFDKI